MPLFIYHVLRRRWWRAVLAAALGDYARFYCGVVAGAVPVLQAVRDFFFLFLFRKEEGSFI